MRLLGQRPRYQEGPPRGPVPLGSPRWGRGFQPDPGTSPDLSAEATLISLQRPHTSGTPGG